MNQTSNTKIKIHRKKAFTLVELIIVITILAILATVAFVSFNGYTKSSRDANRLATLTNIDKGLQAFSITTGKYPVPDDKINITDSGSIIGYQGVIGEAVSRSIQASKIPADPLDGEKYVYSTNSTGKKYQLMTFLETQNTQTAFISQSYADYSKRFPTVQGDNLGIILEENNVPVKRNIEVRGYTGAIIKNYLKNNQVKVGTGNVTAELIVKYNTQSSWKNLDPNCDIDDIAIGAQIWAGCNSTLGDGIEVEILGTPNTLFAYDGVGTSGIYVGDQMKSNAKESDWISAQGKLGVQNNIWGKFYDGYTQDTACPTGWRQPTFDDFKILTSVLYGSNCLGDVALTPYCDGLGWSGNYLKSQDNNLFQALQLPLSGQTNATGLVFAQRGNTGRLKVQITGETDGASVANSVGGNATVSTINILNGGKKTKSAIRCIKD